MTISSLPTSRLSEGEKKTLYKQINEFQNAHVVKLAALKLLYDEVMPVCCHPVSSTNNQSSRSLLFATVSTNYLKRADAVRYTFKSADKDTVGEKRNSLLHRFDNHVVVEEHVIKDAIDEAKSKFQYVVENTSTNQNTLAETAENIPEVSQQDQEVLAPLPEPKKDTLGLFGDIDLDAESASLITPVLVSSKGAEILDVNSIFSRFKLICNRRNRALNIASSIGSKLNISLSVYLRDVLSNLSRISQHRIENVSINSNALSGSGLKENLVSNTHLKRKSTSDFDSSSKRSKFVISNESLNSSDVALSLAKKSIIAPDVLFYLDSPGITCPQDIYKMTTLLNS